jgi:hypothetical protein
MGGLVGRSEDWADFSDAWREVLAESPRIEYFKFNEANKLEKEFQGFSEWERNEKLRRLASVINDPRFDLEALHVTLDINYYATRFAGLDVDDPDISRTVRAIAKPYFYVYMLFVFGACFSAFDRRENQRCELIFDEHPSLGDRVKTWYPVARAFLSERERRISPVEPLTQDDKEFMPLQAADMVAWLQRRATENARQPYWWLDGEISNVRRSQYCVHFDARTESAVREAIAKYNIPDPSTPEVQATIEQLFRDAR